jgi:glycosyltransferase involved in cell wall biosynthesis
LKILIIHYKYSITGGPERYMFNITNLLEKDGHEVIHFSINWNDNIETKQKSFWPKIKHTQGEFHLNRIQNLSFLKKISILINSIYNRKIYKALDNFIKKEKPDIAYLLLFLGKLSPSVIKACNNNKLPVVSRISDFSMICLNSILHDGTRICEDCINGRFSNGVKKKCFKTYGNSFAQLLVKKYFYFRNFHKKISFYVVPSLNSMKVFLRSKYFYKDKMDLLPTFIDSKEYILTGRDIKMRFNKQQFVYWGRISPEKDIELLIKTFHKLQIDVPSVKLVLIGFREDEYSLKILNLINDLGSSSNIETFPFLNKEELEEIVKFSTAYVFPSKIYDNLPQSVLEALSFGLPVIATNIGSLKEIIRDGFTGYLFDPKSKDDLFNKMNFILNDISSYTFLSNNALETVKENYNKTNHLKKLLNIFEKIKNE